MSRIKGRAPGRPQRGSLADRYQRALRDGQAERLARGLGDAAIRGDDQALADLEAEAASSPALAAATLHMLAWIAAGLSGQLADAAGG